MALEMDKQPLPHVDLPAAAIMAEPTDHSPDGLRRWVLEAARFTGLSPTELAREAGLASSTLNRFLRVHDEGSLSAKTIDAILAAAKRLEAEMADGRRQMTAAALEDRPYLVNVQVFGKANATVFASGREHTARLYSIKIPVPRALVLERIGAWEIDDDHASPEYPRGTIVVVTPVARANSRGIGSLDGDHVLVFDAASAPTKGLSSVTIRKVSLSPTNEWWLLRLNRDFDRLPDALLGPLNSGLFAIVGSYRPAYRPPTMRESKKALDLTA